MIGMWNIRDFCLKWGTSARFAKNMEFYRDVHALIKSSKKIPCNLPSAVVDLKPGFFI